jgi:DMSO/TMAO reductase YedYZ molybdopterin-dependent catalytic subunit/uncharacterized membrane protein
LSSTVLQDQSKGSFLSRAWSPFIRGATAGLIALAVNFFFRLAGLVPFPPESAIEAFIKIIPESIQEPSVQTLGDLAGEIGLLVATVIAMVAYGLLGILFERVYAPRIASNRRTSRFEKFLLYSFVPWIFFGLIIFPITDSGLFGISGILTSSSSWWSFPLILLLVQGIYCVSLSWQYRFDNTLRPSKPTQKTAVSGPFNITYTTKPKSMARREFIEKGVLTVGALGLALFSLDQLLPPLLSSASGGLPSGTSYTMSGTPPIFNDPRLAGLVNSEVTSNDNFYRVAIDIFDPSVNESTWNLQLAGLIGNPKSFTLADLQNLPQTEQYSTFECVSNNVNGNLISNAKWTGVKISDLLSDAGNAQASAQYAIFTSVDGYSVGIPLAKAMMSDSLLAYQMNDAALPTRHGYPLRAVIPGLYGMMSAKWITKIELASSPYSGYWQTRGWTNDATVETLAFISVPENGSSLSLAKNNGSIMLGGVAFAGDRGISKVEVSVDGGKTWQTATLKPEISKLTWSLWAYQWTPTSTGAYDIYARATDGNGALQTSTVAPTFPNGATGYAIISVNVTS